MSTLYENSVAEVPKAPTGIEGFDQIYPWGSASRQRDFGDRKIRLGKNGVWAANAGKWSHSLR
jgi:hypothetical protein